MSKSARLSRDSLISNPRATFTAWKRFENIVQAAMQQYPRAYIFKPVTLSNTTVVSRLRDAIRGAIVFEYTDYTNQLANWFDEIVIKEYSDGQVFIGRPDLPAVDPIASENVKAEGYVFDSLSFEELSAFCILLNTNRIEGPIKVGRPPDISILPDYTNVHITTHNDGSITLI